MTPSPHPPTSAVVQLRLQSVSPSLKGQDQNSSRYGVFSQQPPSRSRPDNKENMPEVGVGTRACVRTCVRVKVMRVEKNRSAAGFPSEAWLMLLCCSDALATRPVA